jgi:hypothetical protein
LRHSVDPFRAGQVHFHSGRIDAHVGSALQSGVEWLVPGMYNGVALDDIEVVSSFILLDDVLSHLRLKVRELISHGNVYVLVCSSWFGFSQHHNLQPYRLGFGCLLSG